VAGLSQADAEHRRHGSIRKRSGGVVLCNLNFQETEVVPANKARKRAILAAVLRNSRRRSPGGGTVIAGANLVCAPVDIPHQGNHLQGRAWLVRRQAPHVKSHAARRP